MAEASGKIRRQVQLPSGYYIRWGGQFENLQAATGRLAVVVPLALALIFAMLYFTFGSIKPAALIHLNVPFAAVGGVFDLPVADLLWRACALRMRPVLMTALVASLGFVPMALATGSGAEVQRPLATVVIWGLVTCTALTLFVLPIVYSYLRRSPANLP